MLGKLYQLKSLMVMKVFVCAVILAVITRLFFIDIETTSKNVLLALGVGCLFSLPAIYSLFSGKVFVAGGTYEKTESPLVFYSLQGFSAYLGTIILLLPTSLGIFAPA